MACRKYLRLVCLLVLTAALLAAECGADASQWGKAVIELAGGQTDALHVRRGGTLISNLTIRDRRFYKAAHRDAIQLIPPKVVDKCRRLQVGGNEQDWVVGDQMTGTVLKNVTVEACAINSPYSPLQGIFGGDGMFANLRLVGNRILTAGAHSITINGLLNGEIRDNILQAVNGNTPVIHLYPARIGGNLAEEGMAYILDFADEGNEGSKLQYGKVIIANNRLTNIPGAQAVKISDERFSVPDTHRQLGFGLKHFRYHAFMDRFSNLTFGEYRKQNGGRDFARLKEWLENRIAEYSSGRRIMPDALPGIPAGDERRTHILPLLRKALANAVNSHALDHVSLSNFPETPVRAFTAKQLALQHGELQPLDTLDADNKVMTRQMKQRRQAILKYLLPEQQLGEETH